MTGGNGGEALCLLDVDDTGERPDLGGGEGGLAGDAAACGAVLNLGWGAFGDDASLVHDEDAAREGVGLFEIVRGHEDGLAAGGERADLLPEAAAGLDVHAHSGLVEEDELGVAAEAKAEEQTLLLAAAELLEEAVLNAFELSDLDDLGDGKRVGVVAAEEVDVLADLEGLGDACDLEHGADAATGGGGAGVAAEDAGGAAGRGGEAEEQADAGGFARAVGSEDGDDLAWVERHGEAVEGGDRSVLLGDVVQGGDGGRHGCGMQRFGLEDWFGGEHRGLS